MLKTLDFKGRYEAIADTFSSRKEEISKQVNDAVMDIIDDVKENGDKAILNYCAKFDGFENIEIDGYGRTYAEIVVRAKNSYGAYVPSRYAAGFYDVTDSAPCTIIPKSLAILPGIMVGAQRKVVKSMIKFGTPR